jgi:hypothetical protein
MPKRPHEAGPSEAERDAAEREEEVQMRASRASAERRRLREGKLAAAWGESRDEVWAIGSELHRLGLRVELVGARLGNRKLTHASRMLSAIEVALVEDPEPRALTGGDAWAMKYLDRASSKRETLEARPRPRTVQEAARALRSEVETMKTSDATRWEVAAHLAGSIEEVLALYTLAKPPTRANLFWIRLSLTREIVRTMRRTTDETVGERFDEDVDLTVVRAFKAAGLDPDHADQLFR